VGIFARVIFRRMLGRNTDKSNFARYFNVIGKIEDKQSAISNLIVIPILYEAA
jgi:hypothetical protein